MLRQLLKLQPQLERGVGTLTGLLPLFAPGLDMAGLRSGRVCFFPEGYA